MSMGHAHLEPAPRAPDEADAAPRLTGRWRRIGYAALELAQKALSVTPDAPEIMDTLGWVLYKKDTPQLAIPWFRRCVDKAPTNAIFQFHLGMALVKVGDTAPGRTALERALAGNVGAATASEIRRVLADAGRPSSAQRQ